MFYFSIFYISPINVAVQKGNFEIVQYFLSNKKIDINSVIILNAKFTNYVYKYNFFNGILIWNFNSI